jgi:N-acetylmuramoyl-L-alanine amidase
MRLIWLICLCIFVLTIPSAYAQEKAGISIDQILLFPEEKQEDIYLRLTDMVKPKIYVLERPDRLVIDTPTVQWKIKNPLGGYGGTLVKKVRFAQFNDSLSRLVFDLDGPVEIKETQQFIDRKSEQPIIMVSLLDKRSVKVKRTSGLPPPKSKPSRENDRPLIVIDAGHGDKDPGAIGPNGTMEKRVTLRYARALRDALLKTGRYRVKLTRDDDVFIMLRERVRMARDAKGDLFISLHADSAPDHYARGLSVYTLSEKASDEESQKLAERENKSDIIAGLSFEDKSPDVADILIDLAQRETRNKSAKLAAALVKELGRKVQLLENAQRFAGFAVLKAPDIPSVLVETGFLSNPREEQLLNTVEYQRKVIQGIVNGIDSYFRQTTSSD